MSTQATSTEVQDESENENNNTGCPAPEVQYVRLLTKAQDETFAALEATAATEVATRRLAATNALLDATKLASGMGFPVVSVQHAHYALKRLRMGDVSKGTVSVIDHAISTCPLEVE